MVLVASILSYPLRRSGIECLRRIGIVANMVYNVLFVAGALVLKEFRLSISEADAYACI